MKKQAINIESVRSFVHEGITGTYTYRSTGKKVWEVGNYYYRFVDERGNVWAMTQSYFNDVLERGIIRDVKTCGWMETLIQANKALADKGCRIIITEPEEGFFQCDIIVPKTETYAENYYENELTNLIEDAFHYANTL